MFEVLKQECGIDCMLAVEVNHCPYSFACLIQSEAHGKVLYSGDTLPCQNLINYATNARVLIHEATFQAGLESDAVAKKHTTTTQAIEIGKMANVWRTILTHFSPRYAKVAVLSDEEMKSQPIIAFDHMRVSFSQLEWAPEVVKLYREILYNEESYTCEDGIKFNNEKEKETTQWQQI